MRKEFYMGGLTMGLLAAYFLRNQPDSYSAPVALSVVILAWLLFGRRRTVKPIDYSKPVKPGTRRWARLLFARGEISMEELNEFYRTHPEQENFGDD